MKFNKKSSLAVLTALLCLVFPLLNKSSETWQAATNFILVIALVIVTLRLIDSREK